MTAYEIEYQGTLWRFELKEVTAALAELLENQSMTIGDDGKLCFIGGIGTYKNKRIELYLAQTHDGQAVTETYVKQLPVAVRNALNRIMDQTEGEGIAFRPAGSESLRTGNA